MESITIEFLRFGDDVGIARLSEEYIRIAGLTSPASNVSLPFTQQNLSRAMKQFDYALLDRGDPDEAIARARAHVDEFRKHLGEFVSLSDLPTSASGDVQLDLVTRFQELAQLPFEVLEDQEDSARRIVVTRRVRQPWPPPPVLDSDRPRVLFAWSEPAKRPGSSRKMTVPHERHRDVLDDILEPWGGVGSAATVLPNATRQQIEDELARTDQGYTHVHLLVHGVAGGGGDGDTAFSLTDTPLPSTFLALEDADGVIDRRPPEWLAGLFPDGEPRPASFTLATCHSGEVDPIEAGGTMAHVLHAAGVPVVVASQLALTHEGSLQLLDTFYRDIVKGEDPRTALRSCRNSLRASPSSTWTYPTTATSS